MVNQGGVEMRIAIIEALDKGVYLPKFVDTHYSMTTSSQKNTILLILQGHKFWEINTFI